MKMFSCNSFNTTGSCTRCNESACASSFTSANANTNTALLLTMDTVAAVSFFVVLFAVLLAVLGILSILSVAVIIISAIILSVIITLIICLSKQTSLRLNTALAPKI